MDDGRVQVLWGVGGDPERQGEAEIRAGFVEGEEGGVVVAGG